MGIWRCGGGYPRERMVRIWFVGGGVGRKRVFVGGGLRYVFADNAYANDRWRL